jgi:hypothetical protein
MNRYKSYLAIVGLFVAIGFPPSAQTLQPGAASTPQTPVSLSMRGLKEPRLIHWGSIMNPREPHVGRTVVVGYTVGVDGHTHNLHILKGQGRRYDSLAMLAVAELGYRPGLLNGAAIPVEMSRKIDFVQVDDPNSGRDYPMFGVGAGQGIHQ